jgi:hypothetical protein
MEYPLNNISFTLLSGVFFRHMKIRNNPILTIAIIKEQESKKALLEIDIVIMKIVKELQGEK